MLYSDIYENGGNIRDQVVNALVLQNIGDEDACRKIVSMFMKVKQHVSANDFSVLLKEVDVFLDDKRVAQALEVLSNFGMASEQQFDGEKVKRYEPLNNNRHHDHFICIKCNRIIEFSDDHLEKVQDSLVAKKGCKPLFHKLQVYGMCDICCNEEQKVISIAFAKEDSVVVLDKIDAGWNMRRRLTELGFISGTKIKVVKNSDFGPVVLEVKGSRFALGRGEALKILVFEN